MELRKKRRNEKKRKRKRRKKKRKKMKSEKKGADEKSWNRIHLWHKELPIVIGDRVHLKIKTAVMPIVKVRLPRGSGILINISNGIVSVKNNVGEPEKTRSSNEGL